MSLIGAVVPKVFGLIELLEGYHPRTVSGCWYGKMEDTWSSEDHNKNAFYSVFALFLLLTASQAMQWMLSRIMTLNLLSLYSLMFALFVKTHTTLKVETTKIVNRKYHPINLDCSNINHDFQFSCKFTPHAVLEGPPWFQDAKWLLTHRRC